MCQCATPTPIKSFYTKGQQEFSNFSNLRYTWKLFKLFQVFFFSVYPLIVEVWIFRGLAGKSTQRNGTPGWTKGTFLLLPLVTLTESPTCPALRSLRCVHGALKRRRCEKTCWKTGQDAHEHHAVCRICQ